jgi:TolB-like protein/DNA-binding winged helix-turn-helix (wHTH) protein
VPDSDSPLSEIGDFRVAGYQVEPSALRVIGNGQAARLEPRTMQLLVYLASHAGRVVGRPELEERIWEGRIVGEDALTNSISKLRRTLGDSARHPRIIETVPKTGYRLIAEVHWLDKGTPAVNQAQAESTTAKPASSRHRIGWQVSALMVIVAAAAILGWLLAARDTPDPQIPVVVPTDNVKPTLAIIPFDNLGEQPQDYFANGITTNLITEMSKLSGMTVIARGSVFAYQGSTAETRQISRELDADYVVRGAVQRLQQQVRVNVQLIEAETERALWAERYEGDISDLFRLQDQIASALVRTMRVSLAPQERGIFSQYPTSSVAAYDLFLRGQEEYSRRTPEANLAAMAYFEQALALDRQFARAAAGLALVHSREAIDGWADTPQRSLQRAAGYAEAAERINPTIPQIHFVAGQVALFRQQHDVAIAAVDRAISYAPNYADAYALLAWILNYAGRTDQALSKLQTARRLNPITPASYYQTEGEIRFIQGQYEKAVEAFNATLHINPTHMRARMWLIASLVQVGNSEEARWQVEELLLNQPGFSLTSLGHAFPFRDDTVRQHLLNNLSQAGLPK